MSSTQKETTRGKPHGRIHHSMSQGRPGSPHWRPSQVYQPVLLLQRVQLCLQVDWFVFWVCWLVKVFDVLKTSHWQTWDQRVNRCALNSCLRSRFWPQKNTRKCRYLRKSSTWTLCLMLFMPNDMEVEGHIMCSSKTKTLWLPVLGPDKWRAWNPWSINTFRNYWSVYLKGLRIQVYLCDRGSGTLVIPNQAKTFPADVGFELVSHFLTH